MSDINLSSVNFEHGMLLTPDHLIRQERYFDSALLWALRYCTSSSGLVGAGPRADETERGAVRHDPVVIIAQEENHVTLSVSQCRGITHSGLIVEVLPEHGLNARFAKADLEGTAACGVHIVCTPHVKEIAEGPADEFNPQMKTERRIRYSIALDVSPRLADDSLVVARLRRAAYGVGFERDATFIPPCTTMSGYSELAAARRRILEEVAQLTERYLDLHRAMQEFIILFRERGVETQVDEEALALAGKMVVALHTCCYELADWVQPPAHFFRCLRRFLHSAAVYLDLSPQVQGYFAMLRDTGESELIALLERQRKSARLGYRHNGGVDLANEVRQGLDTLYQLRDLERALEGKYLDFRVNRSLEAMNFLFDRGGKVLYRLAAKPSRTQGSASDIIIIFAQLRLEGRDKYRVVLTGDQNARFEPGTKISAELRINEGSGFRRQPLLLTVESHLAEQCNFDFDFDVPDVPIMTDLRVTVGGRHPIRTALLYVRQRFYGGVSAADNPPARELQSTLPQEPPELPVSPQVSEPHEPPYWRNAGEGRIQSMGRAEEPSPAPPWKSPIRDSRGNDLPPAPPRRRRLE